ncbi:MAG: CHAT domain-containing tetratricopeptide repeat protein [Cyclobacteriaceae bacterium]
MINVLYDSYYYSDYQAGVALLADAELIAIQNNLREEQAAVLIIKAWMAQNFSRLADMKVAISEAEPIVERLDKNSAGITVGDFYYTKASYLTRLGDYFGSIAEYRKIPGINSVDSLLLHDTYNSIGYNFMKAGNPVRSIENYQRAINLLPGSLDETGFIISESLDLQSIGASYLDYFRLSADSTLLNYGTRYLLQAYKNISQAERTYSAIINTTSILTNLSRAYLTENKPDSAKYYLDLARANHLSGDSFLFYVNLGEGQLMMFLQDYPAAIDYYQEAMQIASEGFEKTDISVIDIYVKLSEAYLANGEVENAQGTLREGLTVLAGVKNEISRSSYANLVLPIETSLTKLLYTIYNSNDRNITADSVLHQFSKTMMIVREMRKAFPERTFKEFLSSEGKSLSGMALNTCYSAYNRTKDQKYLEEAYRFSEESKALTLLENIIEYEAINYAGIPDSVIRLGDQYRRELIETEIAIKSGDTLNTDLERKNRQFDEYISYLEKQYPAYYELKYDIKIPGTEEIISELASDEQLLEYFIDGEYTFLISLSASGKQFLKLKNYRQKQIRALLTNLQINPVAQNVSDPYSNFVENAANVYQILTEGVLNDQSDKLIVIPDGVLHLLPFEVLMTQNGELLIEKFTVSYDLSATLMHYKKIRKVNNRLSNYVGFAPQYNGLKTVEVRGEKTIDDEVVRQLGNLRYNESEVQALKNHLGGEVFKGDSATKAAFLQLSENNQVFHLSAHGLYNDRSPLNSAVYFSQQDTGIYREQNVLYAFEIYEQNMQTELGILSSCESGFGEYQSGEGLSSLTRAFYFAGCRSIVASLWNANDKATSGIIGTLGEYLSAGEDKAEALRQAKLSFLGNNNSAYKHPYYWAHLTLSGDTSPIRRPFWPYLIGLFGVIGLGVVLFLIIKRVGIEKK